RGGIHAHHFTDGGDDAEMDRQNLQHQGRSPEKIHIGLGRNHQHLDPGYVHQSENQSDECAEQNANDRQLDRRKKSPDKILLVLDDDRPVDTLHETHLFLHAKKKRILSDPPKPVWKETAAFCTRYESCPKYFL